MRYTRHYPDGKADAWVETTDGDAPSSVEVTLNAKGAAQIGVKFYYMTPTELTNEAQGDIETAMLKVKAALATLGIPLAGAKD